MRIVADNRIPFLKGALEPYADVTYMPGAAIDRQSLTHADALIIRTRTLCNRALLQGTPVKMIATATIGYDHIDTEWCEANGITWCNAPGCNSGSVEQYMGSVLSTLSIEKGFIPSSKTLGIIGVGHVGSKVLRMARALGFNVLLSDPPLEASGQSTLPFVPLMEIVERADIITLHVPLTTEGPHPTFRMFDSSVFAAMRDDQILINTSRGQVVDCQALTCALEHGRIGGAVLDVWDPEPLIDYRLLGHVLIGTPHIAGYSQDGKARGTAMSVHSIARYFDLPCKDWEVPSVPPPLMPAKADLDAQGLEAWEVVRKAMLYTYRVREDDAILRRDPSRFEALRSDYPVRREPAAFTFALHDTSNPEAARRLHDLGFSTE